MARSLGDLRLQRVGAFYTPCFLLAFPALFSAVSRVLLCFWGLADFGGKWPVRSGVIADPEIKRFQLNKATDKFVVLASDGVWDHLDNQRVIDIAARYVDQSAAKAAAAVSDAARKQWAIQGGGYVDDITTVVVKLLPDQFD